MNNNLLRIKVYERLNKLSSFDYDNIECWQIVEAFNKAQLEWVRRQISIAPTRSDYDESSKMQIDDIQNIILSKKIVISKQDLYYETQLIPDNYLYFKRVSVKGLTDCCPKRTLTVYLDETADVDNLLSDDFKKPSWEWGETFCTMQSNKIRIYTNNDFELTNAVLTYYRKPKPIQFKDCVDISSGTVSLTEVICEFKDDIVELIIDGAVAILAGDIESFTQMQRAQQTQSNNE